jgi:hypothetical protein
MGIISRMLRQDRVTMFNGKTEETDNGIRWQATVIEGARVEKGRSMLLRERGIESSEKAMLIIDLRDYKATDDRKYVNAKVWEQYGEEEKKGGWTIRSSFDFFILGDVGEEGRMSSLAGLASLASKEELMNKYEVFSITDVSEEKGGGKDVIILRAAAK